jgi:hypothetical protein
MTIKEVEQQPCDDYISRQAVLELIADENLSMGQVVKGIHALPPVTLKVESEDESERKHGSISKEEIEKYETKKLIDELLKMPPMVIETAYLYAINHKMYGEDVTEKWLTATQNSRNLELAYREGYHDVLQKMRLESEDCDCISKQAVLNLFNKSDEYRWETSWIRKKIEELPPVPNADWISVDERMPEDGQNVLFCDIDNDIMIGYHVRGRQNTHFSQDGTYEDIKNVRAWMSLPKPYFEDVKSMDGVTRHL